MAVGPADALHRLGLSASRLAAPDQGAAVTDGRKIKLRYFAWVRERIGKAEEEIDLPQNVATITELVAWLADRDERYAYAFENPRIVRAAIDRHHVRGEARIEGASEIAFFPP